MKTKIFLTIVLMAMFTACDKEPDPTLPNTQFYEVTFSPLLYGQVIPDMKETPSTKGFNEFVHKYLNHVIRLTTSTGTAIIDIPIVTPQPTRGYTYSLAVGDYFAEVIPVTQETINGPGTYTKWTNGPTGITNRAAIGTSAPVAFTVASGSSAPVVLNCVTVFRCLQFDLMGSQYIPLGVPQPNVVEPYNNQFIETHSAAGQANATYSQLMAEKDHGDLGIFLALTSPTAWLVSNALWYDSAANVYYLYAFGGDGAHYLCFDMTAGTGASMPVIWLKDKYPSATWVTNTTMRVTYTGGSFTINQQSWFNTIITN